FYVITDPANPNHDKLAFVPQTSSNLPSTQESDMASLGDFLYVASAGTNVVHVLRRDPANHGRLSLIQTIQSTATAANGAMGADGVALSADGRYVYVSSLAYGGVGVFPRNTDAQSPDFGKLTLIQEIDDPVRHA